MKKGITSVIIIVILLIVVIALKPFYILEEGYQAVIIRFGKVKTAETDAGLHFKLPAIDNVLKFSKKILSWDGAPKIMPTKESKFIWVDTTARWRITDVRKFYSEIQTMESAFNKLDQIIESNIKTIIAANNLSEAVRETNSILNFPAEINVDVFNSQILSKTVNQKHKALLKKVYVLNNDSVTPVYELSNDISVSDAKILWEILNTAGFKTFPEGAEELILLGQSVDTTATTLEAIEKGRSSISRDILSQVKSITPDYGIEMIDIVIRQIRYSEELTKSVHNRMIQERKQLAQAYRSYGDGQKSEWIGRMNAEEANIISQAKAEAAKVKGNADAKAAKIYADAYSSNQNFYTFWRSLESYKNVLKNFPDKTITTDMPYFDYLYKTNPR
ncbi:MAG: protease modulator HflC [Spirochaetales bacterium]|nr:protease modulator HflC [Spirochaetales bacterium]